MSHMERRSSVSGPAFVKAAPEWETLVKQVTAATEKHPRNAQVYQYGTAGFRYEASSLDPVLFRVGLLAALRSMKLEGKCIGVMVTASHNPAKDNGVKVVDPRGEMLEAAWESHATALSNAKTTEELITVLDTLISSTRINLTTQPMVVYAHDTRSSCPALISALEDGLNCFSSVKSIAAGLKTTPQLHYLVRAYNTQHTPDPYGEPTEQAYYAKLAKAFKTLVSSKQPLSGSITIDCANGVGAPKLQALLVHLRDALPRVTMMKDDTDTPSALNASCGADYVKTNQKSPPGISMSHGGSERYCSLDGDADRLVYYYQTSSDSSSFRLLDGDKIAGLAAMYIMDLVKQAGLEELVQVGVVQTAYANGSSTAYLKKVLQVPVTCTATGVKYLHHAAEKYDVGVYFEANGHGTVLFSSSAIRHFKTHEPISPAQKTALEQLMACTELINQTVGDALSDMLLVEAILVHRQWASKDWDSAYSDLPNRIARVEVEDRSIFITADSERKLTSPKGVQAKIDAIVAKYQLGRSFVRPSGTEDCVRVYAEAATRAEADELALKVQQLITALFGKQEQ